MLWTELVQRWLCVRSFLWQLQFSVTVSAWVLQVLDSFWELSSVDQIKRNAAIQLLLGEVGSNENPQAVQV